MDILSYQEKASEVYLVHPSLFAPYDRINRKFSVEMYTIYPRRGVITRLTLPQFTIGTVLEGMSLRFEYPFYLAWMNWVRGYPWSFVPVLRCEDLIEEFGIIRGVILCRKIALRR
jgi:hypothetical protein